MLHGFFTSHIVGDTSKCYHVCSNEQYKIADNQIGVEKLGHVFDIHAYEGCCEENHARSQAGECVEIIECPVIQLEVLDKYNVNNQRQIGYFIEKSKHAQCCPLLEVHLEGEITKCFQPCAREQFVVNKSKLGEKTSIGYLLDSGGKCCGSNQVHSKEGDECIDVTFCAYPQSEIPSKEDYDSQEFFGYDLNGTDYDSCCPAGTTHIVGDASKCYHVCINEQYQISDNQIGIEKLGHVFGLHKYEGCCEENYARSETGECVEIIECPVIQLEVLDKFNVNNQRQIGYFIEKSKHAKCCPLFEVHLEGEITKCFQPCVAEQFVADVTDGLHKISIGYLLDSGETCCGYNEVHSESDNNCVRWNK